MGTAPDGGGTPFRGLTLNHQAIDRRAALQSTAKCGFADCVNPAHVLISGLCTGHHQQLKAGKELQTLKYHKTPQERFWPRVKKTESCWLWTGGYASAGYGTFWMDGRGRPAHRVSYEWAVGPIPDGMFIDHRCHTPLCVRPDHLRLATPKQNSEHKLGADIRSKSGVRGVYFDKTVKAWVVRVGHHGKQLYGGKFDSLAEAERAAINLRNSLYTHNDIDRRATSAA